MHNSLCQGITIGAVVVPQGMAYSILAGLPPQFGLYSSFMGVLVYWFFATSKDITIGPVAVVSVLVGQILEGARSSHPGIPSHVVASALAMVAGCIIVLIGLVRLGWIVDLIPLVSISAFMSGSAISIAAGQLPLLLGIKGFSTRDSTFEVLYNTFKRVQHVDVDAIVGLSAVIVLYAVRYGCTMAGKKYPERAKLWFFASTLRTVCVILLYTTISYFINRNRRMHPLFSILRTVPGGFQNVAMPTINMEIFSIFASHIPATVLVLLLEHIAIAKSFGRLNNYTIDASQEMVAIGITNILGPFLGAYPATGSFSRTAIKSKAGVKTPFAGVITAAFVLIAIYALPAVFFYIPNAALAAVIMHAVLDLITTPSTILQFWRLSPAEVPIYFAGILVTIFCDIEAGIYTTVVISFALLGIRLLHSRRPKTVASNDSQPLLLRTTSTSLGSKDMFNQTASLPQDDFHQQRHNLLHNGIAIFAPSSSLTFFSANTHLDGFVKKIFDNTRRTNLAHYSHPSQRPWNDTEPLHGKSVSDNYGERPTLKAVVVDFKKVNVLDLTAVMRLLDVKKQLDGYTSPETVEWHFANINNHSIGKTLLAAGFGEGHECSKVQGTAHTVAKYGTLSKLDEELEKIEAGEVEDIVEEQQGDEGSSRSPSGSGKEDLFGCKPVVRSKHGSENFHTDLESAIRYTVVSIRARDGSARTSENRNADVV